MKVAVGSVIYNKAFAYLRDFFMSLEKQTDQAFYILLVNDDVPAEKLNLLLSEVSFRDRIRVVSGDKRMLPFELRIELLKAAQQWGVELLLLADCDDRMSETRVECYKKQGCSECSFFYNEIVDFEDRPVMPCMPERTSAIETIGECNYLGLSNTGLWLSHFDTAFWDSLKEGKTKIFDWYLFSRLLSDGKYGMKIDGCKTIYRIHDENLAGRSEWTLECLKRELDVKKEHYELLKKYDPYYEKLADRYSQLVPDAFFTGQGPDKRFWWGLIGQNGGRDDKVIAVIPARGGSKGLPGKNIKELNGKPLIAYTIEAALKAEAIGRVVVSTDSEEIADVARQWGAEVPFIRPAALSGDTSGAVDVYIHFAEYMREKEKEDMRAFVVLLPTAPLRTAEDIDAAVQKWRDCGAKTLISMTRAETPVSWYYVQDETGRVRNAGFDSAHALDNRQSNTDYYIPNGAIYILDYDLLKNGRTYYDETTVAYVMERERSIDIDSGFDFEMAAFFLNRKHAGM